MMKVLIFKDIKNRRWTIWTTDRRKHLGYADELFVSDAVFIVISEASQRIKKTKKRFPHAWIIGRLIKRKPTCFTPVTYNPFKMSTFQEASGKPVLTSKKVHLDTKGRVLIRK